MFSDTVKKNFKLTIWILLLIVFQTVVCKYISIGGIIPDVILVFVISFAVIENEFSYCTVIPLICGFLLDLLGGRGFGISTLTYMYSGLICYSLSENFLKKKLAVTVSLVILATLCSESIYYTLGISDFSVSEILVVLKEIVLPMTVYNTIITFLIYPILKKTVYNDTKILVRRVKRKV